MDKKTNFSVTHTNSFSEVKNHKFKIPNNSLEKEGKLFLNKLLNLTSMEISLNILKPNEEIPFLHKHKKNEEVYIIVKGEALFTVDKEQIKLDEGSIIKIKPNGARHYKNSSDLNELIMIVIQAKEGSLEKSTIEDGYFVN